MSILKKILEPVAGDPIVRPSRYPGPLRRGERRIIASTLLVIAGVGFVVLALNSLILVGTLIAAGIALGAFASSGTL